MKPGLAKPAGSSADRLHRSERRGRRRSRVHGARTRARDVCKALLRAKLTLDRIDLFELNEAFAAQALACQRELGIDNAKLNVNGGAIGDRSSAWL